MNKRISLFLLSSMLCLTGCGLNPGNSSSSNPNTSSSSTTSESSSSKKEDTSSSSESSKETSSSSSEKEEKPVDDLYKKLFTPENKVEIIADFSNQAIYKLSEYGPNHSPFEKKEMYHPADVVIKINDEVVFNDIEVGFRMRGNTSRIEGFADKNGYFGDRLCNFKMSFNETFDDEEDNDYYIRTWESKDIRKERKNRRFADLKKLDLKWNKNYDNTFTRDSYAKWVYSQEGIVCQKSNLAEVTIKTEVDEIKTLFTIFEPLDSSLIAKNYSEEEAKGNLYKGSWGCSLTKESIMYDKVGVESASNTPVYDLKTNDDEPDHTLLKSLVNTLNNNKTSAAEFKPILDNLINVDQVLKYFALAWVVGNPDDLRSNENNTYFYFNSLTNKLELLPYDDDRCFGILQDWAIDMSQVPDYTTKMAGQDRIWQKNPLLWRLFLTSTSGESLSSKYPVIEEYQQRYYDLCEEYAKKYLKVETFDAFTKRFALAPSTDSSIGGGENQSFKYYAENKIKCYTNLTK